MRPRVNKYKKRKATSFGAFDNLMYDCCSSCSVELQSSAEHKSFPRRKLNLSSMDLECNPRKDFFFNLYVEAGSETLHKYQAILVQLGWRRRCHIVLGEEW